MKSIKDADIKGKKVLMRVDFNVPLNDKHEVTDATRIEKTIPTIQHILDQDGSVILMSHLGRPKGEPDDELSLKHVIPELEKHLKTKVKFASDCVGDEAEEKAESLEKRQVLLLENLRFHPEEKENDKDFAGALASLADVYVNDAFGASHRKHVSISAVAELMNESYAGLLLLNEIEEISKVKQQPKKPTTLIMGGAKVSDKIGVIGSLLDNIDNLLIGGGMAYTFIKAENGQVGKSKLEEEHIKTARKLIDEAQDSEVDVFLPADSVVTKDLDDTENYQVVSSYEIPDDMMGVDIGPKALEEFRKVIEKSKTIIWNGPMGVFEKKAFSRGTKFIGEVVSKMKEKGTYTLIGGGDTTAALKQLEIPSTFSHISTGGGALLEFLEGKDLPGIVQLKKKGEMIP